MDASSVYTQAQMRMREATGLTTGFTQLIAAKTHDLDTATWNSLNRDRVVIEQYFEASLRHFSESLDAQDGVPAIVRLALGDAALGHDGHAHKRLRDRGLLSKPMFFRTDESRFGHVLEIQCPGSMWGEHAQLLDLYSDGGLIDERDRFDNDLARLFAEEVARLLPQGPVIHHLTDNASAPHSMRYFIRRASDTGLVRHYGVDPGITAQSCNFIRSHSVYGLIAENFHSTRLTAAQAGSLLFDLPPHLLFDQKLPLAWPFDPSTRGYYDDEVRNLLAFSSVVTADGVYLSQDQTTLVSLVDFAYQSRADRQYYLKYAGTDVSLNWGSRAVYDLSRHGKDECLRLLQVAANEARAGRPWIIQAGDSEKTEVAWFEHGHEIQDSLNAKRSRFFGPTRLIGALEQHRRFYKVHGGEQTVNTLVLQRRQLALPDSV